MPTIEQRTIDGETYQLKRYKTNKPGKQYEYYITAQGFSEGGTDRRFDDETYYSKQRAMQAWRSHLQQVQTGAGEDRVDDRGPSLPGFGGGRSGGASLPGFGMSGDEDREDDDNEPRLPFF